MQHRRNLIFLVFAIIWVFPSPKSFAGTPVSVCGEPWPPYIYEKESDSQEKKEVAGIHLKNFRLLTALTGFDFKFNILPWKRCLHSVENHSQPGDQEIAIDASFNPERAKKYHLVGPVYAFSTAVFYSRDRHPNGPFSRKFGRVITTIRDMQEFSICGLLGWNYESYYTKHGFPRSVKIDQTPAGIQGVFSMVSGQCCDVVEIHPQLVVGAMITGKLKMPKDIACRKLTGDLQNFYFMVSKKSPRAEKLVTRLSTALIFLKSTGKLVSIKDKGVLPTTGYNDIAKCL
jgi:polar amino acid transport system substrate-binding protein